MKTDIQNNFLQSVLNFINIKSEFALLIDGEWGSGKTYFFENTFTAQINNIYKNRKIWYATCNGIRNFEEVELQLFLSACGIKQSNKSYIKTAIILGSNALDFIKEKTGVKKVKGIKANYLVEYDNGIFLVDDIERINFKNFPIDEFLGRINEFAKYNPTVSVVLIGNEKELVKKLVSSSNDSDEYTKIKEKTIFRTLEFKTNLEEAVKSLNLIISNDLNKELVINNLEEILSYIRKFNLVNLRTIQYVFMILNQINLGIDKTKYKEGFSQVFLFTFFVSLLYKEGIKNSIDLKESLKDLTVFSIMVRSLDNNSLLKLTTIKIMSELILENSNKYHYFSQIYDFIYLGDLNQDTLKNELNALYDSIDLNNEVNIVLARFSDFRNQNENTIKEDFNSCMDFVKKNKMTSSKLIRFISTYSVLVSNEIVFDSMHSSNTSNLLYEYISNTNINFVFDSLEDINLEDILIKINMNKDWDIFISKLKEMELLNRQQNQNQNILICWDKLIDNISSLTGEEMLYLLVHKTFSQELLLKERFIQKKGFARVFISLLRNDLRFHKDYHDIKHIKNNLDLFQKSMENGLGDFTLEKYFNKELKKVINYLFESIN